ncbi:hypothetical protein ACTFIZ_003969 [Dictyostelium cf. discoideum]
MDIAQSIQELNSNYGVLVSLSEEYTELIEDNENTIQNLIDQLKRLTQINVDTEQKLEDTRNQLGELEKKESGFQSELNDLRNDINSMNEEIEEDKRKIQEQMPKLDAGYILSHIFNPIGSAISDSIRFFTNNIKELTSKIDYNNQQINQKQTEVNDLQPQLDGIRSQENQLTSEINSLKEQEKSLEEYIKQSGIQKTKVENCKLSIEQMKTKCMLLIDRCKDEKDLIDEGIILKKEIDDFNSDFQNFLSSL